MALLRDPYRGDDPPPDDDRPWWRTRFPKPCNEDGPNAHEEETMPETITGTMKHYTARDTLARIKRAVVGLPEDQQKEVFGAIARCMADVRNEITLAYTIVSLDLEKLREAERVDDWRNWCDRVSETAQAKHGIENAVNVCKILAGEEPSDG